MELEERQISVGDLLVGMYVCRLDRPWGETQFPLQGFLLESAGQIEDLRRLCRHVVIDVERGIAPDPRLLSLRRAGPAEILRGTVEYADTNTVEEELPLARGAHDNAIALVGRIMSDVQSGRAPTAAAINEAVTPIVKSVLRSRDAFFWFEALRKRDSYSYGHAVSCCALAAALGRHLGFPHDVLVDLSTGALLMDIGKAEVPDDLLQRAGPLGSEEMLTMRGHVEKSLSILDRAEVTNEDVRSIVRTHHERNDGSGYPAGLAGTQIPLFGRIAGMIDSYDAMTNDRPYRKAAGQHAALQHLYAGRDKLFQSELVEQFMMCLGVYPTGSLVELSTGEVAVVMAQNQSRRLRPRILVLTTENKVFDERLLTVDLMMQHSVSGEGDPSYIVRALEPGAYGLDVTNLYL
jgi:cyclic di-GMP phosphodiesterase